MEMITVTIVRARKWEHPHPWMTDGWSTIADLFHLHPGQSSVDLPAGGWSLHAADLLRLEWQGSPDTECLYHINHNQTIIHRGLWRPLPNQTIAESFFVDGDLYVWNYRRLVRGDTTTGVLPAELPTVPGWALPLVEKYGRQWHGPGR